MFDSLTISNQKIMTGNIDHISMQIAKQKVRNLDTEDIRISEYNASMNPEDYELSPYYYYQKGTFIKIEKIDNVDLINIPNNRSFRFPFIWNNELLGLPVISSYYEDRINKTKVDYFYDNIINPDILPLIWSNDGYWDVQEDVVHSVTTKKSFLIDFVAKISNQSDSDLWEYK